MTGKQVRLDVEPTATVKSLYILWQDSEGVPISNQKFIYGNKWLSYWSTLADYGIKDGDLIYFMVHVDGGGVSFSHEPEIHLSDPLDYIDIKINFRINDEEVERHEYRVGYPYTIDSLMGMIQTNQHIPRARQIVKYKDVQLKEFSTLADYQINPGEIIELEVVPRFAGWKPTSVTTAQTPNMVVQHENMPPVPPPPATKGSVCCIIM